MSGPATPPGDPGTAAAPEAATPAASSGAVSLLRTLVASGVDTCFANPGTSEMHFVAALDAVPGLRPVLALFEGVATGAADGYGRMTGRPASVLLHLGPGLGNGLANLHNARRAHTPVVVVVGDHATYHKALDAPLESDIDALAGTVSGWVRRSWRPGDVGADGAAAVRAARDAPGRVATLILPADVSWGAGGVAAAADTPTPPAPVPAESVDAAVAALAAGPGSVLVVGGAVAASDAGLAAAAAIAERTGARLLCETFPARLRRGAGRPPVNRVAYLGEAAVRQFGGAGHVVVAGAAPLVSFFAYPGRPSRLLAPDARRCDLAGPGDDAVGALLAVADRLGAPPARLAPSARPERPSGPLDAEAVAAAVGATLPADAIVVDEAISSGGGLGRALGGAPPHDYLTLTGGAIGFGLPTATGAAVACPDRPVVCLQADGAALYTLTALWTQAREGLDVTTVVFNNRAYAILQGELDRVGAGGAGPVASGLLDLGRPDIDFVGVARGLGVPAERAATGEELTAALERAFAEAGPHLVEVRI